MVAAWNRDPRIGEERLNEAVRRLVEALHPERIYLFGSRARGDFHADSDWDLMIVLPGSETPSHAQAREAYAAISDLRMPSDLIVWSRSYFDRMAPARASLSATILREGRLLYAA